MSVFTLIPRRLASPYFFDLSAESQEDDFENDRTCTPSSRRPRPTRGFEVSSVRDEEGDSRWCQVAGQAVDLATGASGNDGIDPEDLDDDEEDTSSLPSLSPSQTSGSSSEDEEEEYGDESTDADDYFFSGAAHVEPDSFLSTTTSLLFGTSTPSTSPTKRSAPYPLAKQHGAKRALLRSSPPSPSPLTSSRPARLPDLVVKISLRHQPLQPMVQCVTAFDADVCVPIPLDTITRPRPAPRDEGPAFDLDLDLGLEPKVDDDEVGEAPWDWDTYVCPPSPRAKPACLELAPPAPLPPTARPRVVANPAQLLMLSLEGAMMRRGKIVSPLRQRGVVLRRGRAEAGSALRREVLLW